MSIWSGPVPSAAIATWASTRSVAVAARPSRRTCSSTSGAQSAALIEDEAKIQQAKSGPDIHCPYCGARNAAGTKRCKVCGGALEGGQARQVGQVLGALPTGSAEPVTCTTCGALNAASATRCESCGAVLPRPQAGATSRCGPACPASPPAAHRPDRRGGHPAGGGLHRHRRAVGRRRPRRRDNAAGRRPGQRHHLEARDPGAGVVAGAAPGLAAGDPQRRHGRRLPGAALPNPG